MRLAEARKLQPGDRVMVEGKYSGAHAGKVIRATTKGGVLVEIDGESAWYPYSRVQHANALTRQISSLLFE